MPVEFEGDFKPVQQNSPSGFSQSSQVSGMAGWLIKKGIIKEESQAKMILLGIVIANFILAGFVFIYFVF